MHFLVFLLFSYYCTLAGCVNDEGLALLSFRESVYQQGSLDNWNSSDANPCAWNGIRCMEDKVVLLSFPNHNLSGFLSPALGKLSSLRHINLRNNMFSGSLPAELFDAGGLQSLYLSGNSFSGPLPPEMGRLSSLQKLDLSQNSFSGSIPASIQQCKKLKVLVLSHNNFTGSIPDGLGTSLVSLTKLDFSFNSLSGSIPDDIGSLSSLQGALNLSHNLLAYCWSLHEKLLIYDYIPNGDLATAIHGKARTASSKPPSWPVRLRIMKGIARGLAYLHDHSTKKYVHGDLKPSNILLGNDMKPHISNFGLGRLAEPQLVQTPQQSSPYMLPATSSADTYYLAPEASRLAKPSQKWDIYSYGVIVLEMISRKAPLLQMHSPGSDPVGWIQFSIEKGKPLRDLLDPCLAYDLNKQEIIVALQLGLACVHECPKHLIQIHRIPETDSKWL